MNRHYHPDFRTTLNLREDDPPTLQLNAASIGSCRRALIYRATDTKRTSEISNIDHTGIHTDNVLKEVITESMSRAGWTIQPTRQSKTPELYADWRPHRNIRITGLPHAYGAHPYLTKNAFSTITTTWHAGRPAPSSLSHKYLAAMSAFFQANASPQNFDPDGPAVIATLDMTTLNVTADLLLQESVAETNKNTVEHLAPLSEFLHHKDPLTGDLPERDFPKGSIPCNRCPWSQTCRQPEANQIELKSESSPVAF